MDEFSFFIVLLFFITSIFNSCFAMITISRYRLVTTDRPNSGIIELYNQDVGWGRVCESGLTRDTNLARAVCHHLNFPGTSIRPSSDNFAGVLSQQESPYYWDCSVELNSMNTTCDYFDDYYTCEVGYTTEIEATTCKEPGYLGCFTDPYSFPARDRVFPNLTEYPKLTISKCISECTETGFFFAGVEYEKQCFCGRAGVNYTRHGTLLDGECNYECAGDILESCGGSDKIAVYQVNIGICVDPGPPVNGFRNIEGSSLRYGNKISFGCSDGYILQGPRYIQCVQMYGGRENSSNVGSPHAVKWSQDPPTCTRIAASVTTKEGWQTRTMSMMSTVDVKPTGEQRGISSSSPSPSSPLPAMPSVTTHQEEETDTITLPSTDDLNRTENQRGIIYISVGTASGVIIIVLVIGVVFLCRRHNRKTHNPVRPVTESTCASSHHDNGAGSPLMSRADGEHDFALTELTSHPETAGENDYGESIELRTPMRTEMPDRPGISRDAFGYESIRLPSTDDASAGLPGITDAVTANEVAYENSEFHEDPTHLIDNELYGKTFL